MSVSLVDGVIRLEGVCPVEDAEILLGLLQEDGAAMIDWNQCVRVHMAVAQILLAAGRPSRGIPSDPFCRDWLLPQLERAMSESNATDINLHPL